MVKDPSMLQLKNKRYSDWIANADSYDDRELEDEWDPDDAIVQDTGFGHLWV